ncbi:DUF6083 domain-containing protein [Nocardia speluncae]|uniref:DUF6083 domain-containing protein n=1 Tax=Nocardia TaxID=1817 RepID=UPI00157C9175|nr:DUF6083 domain-containing protein [Nocardia speluncae]
MSNSVCMVCGASEGAQERPVPMRTVTCDQCWDEAVKFPDREPEKLDLELTVDQLRVAPVADAREGTPTACKHCETECSWHRTRNGRWLLMEPGFYPTAKIPPGKRWRVAGDGTAINLGGANPTDECRITHFDVCPARRAPEDGTLLLAIWRGNHREWMARQNQ